MGGQNGQTQGDFTDPVTSPNDPIWMLHHANLDRNKMSWMVANADAEEYFYGFSTTGNTISQGGGGGPPHAMTHTSTSSGNFKVSAAVYGGLGLFDYVSSAWGFTDLDAGIGAHGNATDLSSTELWTHADALCYLQPKYAPYTYDVLG